MDPQRWTKIESLYHAALAKDRGERSAYLDEACAQERELRHQVESLLGCADTELRSPVEDCHRWPPGFRLGSYEIHASLGVGGMGEVYRARDTKLRREVAIKVLPLAFQNDPSRLARFEREAQVLASLNHPNIGAIYGLEESEGIRFLVLELVEGPTLAERLVTGPMKVDDALQIAAQIGNALTAVHQKGIIHRDLKPANVKISVGGVVKLLDFGLAKVFSLTPDSDPANATNPPPGTGGATVTGTVLGTAAYMSPEQARRTPADHRTDIWAFGVVLWEMLTGTQPFTGQTTADVLASVVNDEPHWDLAPKQLRPFLKACLHKNPFERPYDLGETMRLMEAISVRMRTKSRLPWVAAAILTFGSAAFQYQQIREYKPILPRRPSVPEVVPFGRPGSVRLRFRRTAASWRFRSLRRTKRTPS